MTSYSIMTLNYSRGRGEKEIIVKAKEEKKDF